MLQSIRFNNSKYTEKEAEKWLKEHNYKPIRLDKRKTYLGYRINEPIENAQYYSKFITDDIYMIFMK